MQDREDRSIASRIGELVGMPARRERSRLRLAVPHDRADEQVRIVERGAVGVGERIAELAPFVDRARDLGRDVTGDASGKRDCRRLLDRGRERNVEWSSLYVPSSQALANIAGPP